MTNKMLSANVERLLKDLHSMKKDHLIRERRLERHVKNILNTKVAEAPVMATQRLNREAANKNAVVVAWDMSHNPVGRALVLHDLLETLGWNSKIIGPSWGRYGTTLWSPLQNSDVSTKLIACEGLHDLYSASIVQAMEQDVDLVYVSKPRFPSLLMGKIISEYAGCPMILDIDDHELSFFKNEDTILAESALASDLSELAEFPFEEYGTRLSEDLIQYADAITVSNVALKERYGGIIVRHARDEHAFDPAVVSRENARENLGLTESDFALVFVGTLRPHKGIFDVLDALEEMSDDYFVLHIVGRSSDKRIRDRVSSYSKVRIVQHDNCDFSDLPKFIAAADCVPLMQTPDHKIAQYQIPAKISDALSFGVEVVCTDVPPLADLHHKSGLNFISIDDLKSTLSELKKRRSAERKLEIRNSFLEEFSFDVNAGRLNRSIDFASAASEDKPVIDTPFDLLIEKIGQQIVEGLPAAHDAHFEIPEELPQNAPDMAVFWKQNDSGLFGRRIDMIAKYLLREGLIKRIIVFDAPTEFSSLTKKTSGSETSSIEALKHRSTMLKTAGLLDSSRFVQKAAITQAGKYFDATDKELSAGSFVEYVKHVLDASDLDPENTIGWFCPVIWDADELIEAIPFKLVVSDIIDDQRAWDIKPRYRAKLDESYRELLGKSHVVFSNCSPVADVFQPYAKVPISIVPNGAERFDLLQLDRSQNARPRIGYVGNLRDRIDWDLLREVITAKPEWDFVFAGPSADPAIVEEFTGYGNVEFPGTILYGVLPELLATFDVGLVPHTVDDLTKSMNPLKVYNYIASGLPVVSTSVPNLEDVAVFVSSAYGAEEFISHIEDALSSQLSDQDIQERQNLLQEISWDGRTREIWNTIEGAL